MFDPAAVGTLLIGLDGDQATDRRGHRRLAATATAAATTPRRDHAIRLTLARGLRRAAALLEPRTRGELAG